MTWNIKTSRVGDVEADNEAFATTTSSLLIPHITIKRVCHITMASTSIPRFLLPRGQLYMRNPRLQQYAASLSLRYASTSGPQKARLLEKPDKFRAPSHPQRLRKQRPSYAGPALSEQELEAQKTKQYPHMMPPDGSFRHWFLTNKFIHLWITLVGRFPFHEDEACD